MKLLLFFLLLGCAHGPDDASNGTPPPVVPVRPATVAGNGCGLEGNIGRRIEDCDISRADFVLVMRSGKDEVYKDTKSGFFWGPRLRYETNFYGAGKVCHEMGPASLGEGIQWRLPSIHEYEEAHRHGLEKAFTDMDHWFWTSTFRGRKLKRFTPIQMWKGMEGEAGQNLAEEAASVRCLGRARN